MNAPFIRCHSRGSRDLSTALATDLLFLIDADARSFLIWTESVVYGRLHCFLVPIGANNPHSPPYQLAAQRNDPKQQKNKPAGNKERVSAAHFWRSAAETRNRQPLIEGWRSHDYTGRCPLVETAQVESFCRQTEQPARQIRLESKLCVRGSAAAAGRSRSAREVQRPRKTFRRDGWTRRD